MDPNMLFMLVIIVLMVLMMSWASRKNKQQQAQVKDFRASLESGTLVITTHGVIGKVVSVDNKYEEVVIDSEGSLLRFRLSSVSQEYVRPAYIDDDEVDEDGNPIDSETAESGENADAEVSAVAIDSPQSAQSDDSENAEQTESADGVDVAASSESGETDAVAADLRHQDSDSAEPQA